MANLAASLKNRQDITTKSRRFRCGSSRLCGIVPRNPRQSIVPANAQKKERKRRQPQREPRPNWQRPHHLQPVMKFIR